MVWKTFGGLMVNPAARYSATNLGPARRIGFNNIKLSNDHSSETNFGENAKVKKRWPDRVVIASFVVDTRKPPGLRGVPAERFNARCLISGKNLTPIVL